MHRRTALSLAVALAVVPALAGCGATGTGDGAPTTTARFQGGFEDVYAAENGDLVVVATVHNPGADPREGTVYVSVTVDGTEHTEARYVSLAPNETVQREVRFAGVSYEAFGEDGGPVTMRFD